MEAGARRAFRGALASFLCLKDIEAVAKVSPGEFFRQVRAETAKVVWPTRKETVTTGIMVVIMTTLLGIFFFGVDSAFSAIVQALLGLLS
jgi:preprotein translocase subunit SecE